MKLILLEHIEKLGKKYEVVEVADGYARNYLLPEGKAQMATESNLKQLENKKQKEEERRRKKKSEIETLIKKVKGKELIIKMKAGEKDQLFESVDSQDISKALKDEGFEVSAEEINLESPIKELTEKEIQLIFDKDLKTTINVKIEEQ